MPISLYIEADWVFDKGIDLNLLLYVNKRSRPFSGEGEKERKKSKRVKVNLKKTIYINVSKQLAPIVLSVNNFDLMIAATVTFFCLVTALQPPKYV